MNLAEQVYENIVQAGWGKGQYASSESCFEDGSARDVCLIGSINLAIYNDPWRRSIDYAKEEVRDKICRLIAKVINEQFPDLYSHLPYDLAHYATIMYFNDHKDTTLEDIELVCKKASMRLEEEVS